MRQSNLNSEKSIHHCNKNGRRVFKLNVFSFSETVQLKVVKEL